MSETGRVKRIFVSGSADTIVPIGVEIEKCAHEAILFEAMSFEALPMSRNALDWLSGLKSGDWIVFSSRNSVRFFLKTLYASKVKAFPTFVKIAAVGPSTEAELKKNNIHVHFVPQNFGAEYLAKTLPFEVGSKIYLPQAEDALEDLERGLRNRDAQVEAIPVYKTILSVRGQDALVKRLMLERPDLLLFTSPSSVMAVKKILGSQHDILTEVRVIAMGTTTAQELSRHGYRMIEKADEQSAHGLIGKMKEIL